MEKQKYKRKIEFDSKDVIKVGELTDWKGNELKPRGLTPFLKSLGFKKSELKWVNGKKKRCIPIEKNHIEKQFKRYGFSGTMGTVGTVVTDSSMINNEGINGVINNVREGSGANRIHRSNRTHRTKQKASKDNPVCLICDKEKCTCEAEE